MMSDTTFHMKVIEEMLTALKSVEHNNPHHFKTVMQFFMRRNAVAGPKDAHRTNA